MPALTSASDVDSQAMTVLFILNTLLLTYNFYKAWRTDPGFLKSNREDKVKVSAAYCQ